jgi:hypothetical protein
LLVSVMRWDHCLRWSEDTGRPVGGNDSGRVLHTGVKPTLSAVPDDAVGEFQDREVWAPGHEDRSQGLGPIVAERLPGCQEKGRCRDSWAEDDPIRNRDRSLG